WNEDTAYTGVVLNIKHYFNQAAATLFTVRSLIQAIYPRHGNNRQRRRCVLLANDLLERILAFLPAVPSQQDQPMRLRFDYRYILKKITNIGKCRLWLRASKCPQNK